MSEVIIWQMCNAYEIGGQAGSFSSSTKARGIEELAHLRDRQLVRRTDSAPVVTAAGEARLMSWGFRRKGLGVVNNSRTDNLESPMWRLSYRERRCLIPVAGYFEWKGPTGKKETFRVESLSGEWLWMAGIWEESQDYGPCYSMLTMMADRELLPLHHRMPVMLAAKQQEDYLRGGEVVKAPRQSEVRISPSENPLVRKSGGAVQGDLF